ncbi:MAG: T9SS type A sorting domain-containing protein [Ignavibacteria bacterium]|nr:T9SS type A sorting domain-containing protein [Ignavibacteria bacterium]MCU7502086.1 T9SS type A sorting domain-containing protein [Ignavibacteria bacterium]MCU7515488.1 T9SS type A sorting domain-containing protein [Ignavibacteria bacterium]
MVVFKSGIIWGAKIKDSIHVGGSTYQSSLQPGKIISPGVSESPFGFKNRIYRVRPDYKTADLSIEVSEEGGSASDIRTRYEQDWMDWPASEGAPFVDMDGDGKYDPNKDIPGVKDALQTIWFVANDLDQNKSLAFYGSTSMGIEMQATMWAYDKDWILNNTYFKKYKLINKSNNNFKDMYISFWTDPDLGDGNDDLAGCDTLLNLGYVYNDGREDAIYGNYPPAVGFDILQGPLVKGISSDSAIFNGRRVYGKKNLPMNAFYYFIPGDNNYRDPEIGNNYQKGAVAFYNFMQGKMGENYFPVPAELGGGVTKFPLSGDPVSSSGYLDGSIFRKGDRRLGMASGPFDLAPGDTQEVVISEMVAQSSNNLQSVKLLKLFSTEIQKKYDAFFKFPEIPAPESPRITGTYSKNSITINIPENAQVENFDQDGFKFQGYNVYQLPNGVPEKRGALYLGTFDKIDGIRAITGRGVDTLTGAQVNLMQQRGSDSGILREVTFTRDSLGHAPFLIGRKYYFGISAYTYRNDPVNNFTNTESPLGVVAVTFQDSLPGLKYNDALKITRISGQTEGTITPIVIDPTKLTGDDYQIGFDNENGISVLYLKDLTKGYRVTKDESALYGSSFAPVYDGIYIKVADVQPGLKEWQIPHGSLKWSWSGATGLALEGFNGAMGYGGTWPGTSAGIDKLHNVLIKFASTDSSGNILDAGDPNVSYAYRYLRNSLQAPAKPEFAQFIINKGSGYVYQDFIRNFPFAAYDMESNPPRRLAVGYLENNATGGLVDGKYWPPTMGQDNFGASSPREWFFIFDVPYGETLDAELQGSPLSGSLPVLWMGTPTRISNMTFSSDDQFLILRSHPFTSEDVFTFTMERQASDVKTGAIPLSYEMSQNYPNPFNPVTTIRYSIPEASRVELKVYDILGREVTTLVNKDQNRGSYSVQFDAGKLSSGIYIYRISAKNFTKTSKMVLLK